MKAVTDSSPHNHFHTPLSCGSLEIIHVSIANLEIYKMYTSYVYICGNVHTQCICTRRSQVWFF